MPAGFIALLLSFLLLLLWPLIFMEVMLLALDKLGIPLQFGVVILLALLIGSLINIPIMRLPASRKLESYHWMLYGLGRWFSNPKLLQPRTIIAVNLGGCVVPLLLVGYEISRLASMEGGVAAAMLATLINLGVCYKTSRVIAGRGITIPILLPGVLAAISGLLLYPENSPVVAYCAGVLGPLIGADLLRLGNMKHFGLSIISIGGAGTFDGIVISGFIALLLA